ncbi:malto-oligosyltrehalose synthase, partial [Streptomyces sp. SP17BM10]|nr:malto-oligosyltrehalose synthase [Streptomyces sp. SP17BM10]
MTGVPPGALPIGPGAAADAAYLRSGLDDTADATDRLVAGLALGEVGGSDAHDEACARFAQPAAAVAAKGVADTAFYRWHALPGHNAVGGDPARPGLHPADFHDWCRYLERAWPHS